MIHDYLSNSYWAQGIPKSVLAKAMQNSLCFAVFDKQQQIGFARMTSDKATFAYLADVFVIEGYQGKGAARALMTAVMDHPDLQGLRRVMLATRDAHGLYEKYGFKNIADASNLMQIHQPDVYQ